MEISIAIKNVERVFSNSPDIVSDEDIESVEFAIEAMEKQEPMKPYKYRTEGDMSQDVYECIECETVIFRNDKYCRHCGQKVDWEETNERNTIQR